MSKERLTAFFDAVLAIIMTILVLELEKPSEISLKGFLSIKEGFFAYTLSFFWLGSMWINHHNEWIEVDKINKKTVWCTMFILFFSSFFPYSTSIVAKNFYNTTAQLFYGIVIIAVTAANMINRSTLYKSNRKNKEFLEKIRKRNLLLSYDLALKVISFLISAFFYPPTMMVGLFITMIFITYQYNKK